MGETKLNVYQRLLEVQKELVAPRAINGRFGKARSAEQILEAAKPLCQKHGLYLHTTDDIQQIGLRNYVIAIARVYNVDNPEEVIEASASAWEGDVSNGLDTSQVSGKTSSYAKKYALQNLFAIDDTKDADISVAKVEGSTDDKPATDDQKVKIKALLALEGLTTVQMPKALQDEFKIPIGSVLTYKQAAYIIQDLQGDI
jgi:ERF superfamily protein